MHHDAANYCPKGLYTCKAANPWANVGRLTKTLNFLLILYFLLVLVSISDFHFIFLETIKMVRWRSFFSSSLHSGVLSKHGDLPVSQLWFVTIDAQVYYFLTSIYRRGDWGAPRSAHVLSTLFCIFVRVSVGSPNWRNDS